MTQQIRVNTLKHLYVEVGRLQRDIRVLSEEVETVMRDIVDIIKVEEAVGLPLEDNHGR